ncbi:MAG: hypothetical protein WA821_20635 [Anaerolineales bacterium]
MSLKAYNNPLFHQEPAHPGVIKLHDDLINIYKFIRENYQKDIDAAFDKVSRQIGFVVMTTIPLTLQIADKETQATLMTENLKGTLFEEAFLKVVEGWGPRLLNANIPTGSYKIYLIWYDALKLKLHTDWMEPAHLQVSPVAQDIAQMQRKQAIKPGILEPVHWFDSAFTLESDEALIISAINEVYPELRLVERVQTARQTQMQAAILSPGIREPAHFRQILERFDAQTLDKVMEVIQAIQQMRG